MAYGISERISDKRDSQSYGLVHIVTKDARVKEAAERAKLQNEMDSIIAKQAQGKVTLKNLNRLVEIGNLLK